MIKTLNCFCGNNIINNKIMKVVIRNYSLDKEFSCNKCKLKIIQNPNSNELDIEINGYLIKETPVNGNDGMKDNILFLNRKVIIKIFYEDNVQLLLDKYECYSIFQ